MVSGEEMVYGYTDENRYMVECFIDGEMPRENWNDGLLVTQLLMSAYMSSEKGQKLSFPPVGLEDFVPKVARETYDPRSVFGD